MIKKLRLKFVIINMSIVTILLGIILGMVYYFTRSEMEMQSIDMMKNIALGPYRMNTPFEPDGDIRLPYFTIRLGPDGERIEAGGSYYDLTNEEALDEIMDKARDPQRRMGIIKKYNLRYCRIDGQRNQYLVFADISSELATLEGLMRSCLLIGLLGFLGFLGASILLSGWAVRPVNEAFERQKKFIADASHELKTPLTVIMTNAQIIQDGEHSREAEKHSTENILTMSRQMKKLIEQMLSLSRTESGEQRLVFSELDMSKTAAESILPFEPVFFEEGLELTSDIDEGLRVMGDRAELQRLLDIMLDNACKYSSPYGRTLVSLKRRGRNRLRLTVENEGEAIPEEKLESIFERFYRADEARGRDGSFGLGLPIAKSIAQRHKGRIWAESGGGRNKCIFEMNLI